MFAHQSRCLLIRALDHGLGDGFVIFVTLPKPSGHKPIDAQNRPVEPVEATLKPNHHLAVLKQGGEQSMKGDIKLRGRFVILVFGGETLSIELVIQAIALGVRYAGARKLHHDKGLNRRAHVKKFRDLSSR